MVPYRNITVSRLLLLGTRRLLKECIRFRLRNANADADGSLALKKSALTSKNTGAPLKTSPFGRVQNRHLVREVRVLTFGNRRTVLSHTSSRSPRARLHDFGAATVRRLGLTIR